MTDQSVLSILDRIRRRDKVRPFSPHDFRRSFISDLLDRGADIATVQRMVYAFVQ
jgi:site-specific recombinase XerD